MVSPLTSLARLAATNRDICQPYVNSSNFSGVRTRGLSDWTFTLLEDDGPSCNQSPGGAKAQLPSAHIRGCDFQHTRGAASLKTAKPTSFWNKALDFKPEGSYGLNTRTGDFDAGFLASRPCFAILRLASYVIFWCLDLPASQMGTSISLMWVEEYCQFSDPQRMKINDCCYTSDCIGRKVVIFR
ncbi:hypothetical protein Y1Q_0010819 [Alligator mississippiensis]|uniref:Uncharacterized protein n=1 Tax=Alligator mississippiensis TaxID=8496 RepID=A0A151M6W9_ALLMI|nr:hypothetical protein Y1Q_0010819 [Alligator mississippiensis]